MKPTNEDLKQGWRDFRISAERVVSYIRNLIDPTGGGSPPGAVAGTQADVVKWFLTRLGNKAAMSKLLRGVPAFAAAVVAAAKTVGHQVKDAYEALNLLGADVVADMLQKAVTASESKDPIEQAVDKLLEEKPRAH